VESKFRVELDIREAYHGDTDTYYTYLENVSPKSLSIDCPHCGVYSTMRIETIVKRINWQFDLTCSCTHCEKSVFVQVEYITAGTFDSDIAPEDSTNVIAIYPRKSCVNIPSEIPEIYRDDYREALLVADISPKASAALSRRILQAVIREKFNIIHKTLDKEIDEFIKLKDIPSSLAESVDAIRVVGNFAAHPQKTTNTGEILDVEPGESEWLIDVLEQLFDFAFIRPAKLKEQKDKLNAKLQSAGKPVLKKPGS
jgi:hypothetical protein